MAISEQYIMRRLQQYVHSTYYNNVPPAESLISRQDVAAMLYNIKSKFIAAVRKVIPSFRGDGVVTTVDNAADPRGYVYATISVNEDALSRASLHHMNQDCTITHGGGIQDILALFTHGYTLSKRPYGFWVRSGGASMERIGARMHRDPNPFLEEFVQEMNNEYAGRCVLALNNKYE